MFDMGGIIQMEDLEGNQIPGIGGLITDTAAQTLHIVNRDSGTPGSLLSIITFADSAPRWPPGASRSLSSSISGCSTVVPEKSCAPMAVFGLVQHPQKACRACCFSRMVSVSSRFRLGGAVENHIFSGHIGNLTG